MQVRIDPTKCNGYGRCADLCPDVFQLDEWGQAYVAADFEAGIPDHLQAAARAAADACPEDAIALADGES